MTVPSFIISIILSCRVKTFRPNGHGLKKRYAQGKSGTCAASTNACEPAVKNPEKF
jgi:hypothetical protein